MIVEDDRDQLDILSRLFLRAGYEVVAVHHPRPALEAATFRSFQVALLDQGLPDMEGMQLMQHLRRIHSGLQVVLLTGQSDPAFKARAEDEGAFVCLEKPCRVRQIEDAVNLACDDHLDEQSAYGGIHQAALEEALIP